MTLIGQLKRDAARRTRPLTARPRSSSKTPGPISRCWNWSIGRRPWWESVRASPRWPAAKARRAGKGVREAQQETQHSARSDELQGHRSAAGPGRHSGRGAWIAQRGSPENAARWFNGFALTRFRPWSRVTPPECGGGARKQQMAERNPPIAIRPPRREYYDVIGIRGREVMFCTFVTPPETP